MSKYNYPHPVPWTGKDLKGAWQFTIKIDGVRMLRDEAGNPISRNGKPLYNLENVPEEISDAEIYYGSWEESISHCRSRVTAVGSVDGEHVYSLFPVVDKRLDLGIYINPTAEDINTALSLVLAEGHEGLVLREIDGKGKLYKVKPNETYDVEVIGMVEGTGKHRGRMGALLTPMGNVGTGFTDKEREWWWSQYPSFESTPRKIIEVECWELTKSGQFRHPRYIRLREDK
ncbi:hypothetical protein [Vibrio phage JPW]|nr:hypothetical protein [Vibrio phage JPW]